MGKGDVRTRRGKIFNGSYGKTRPGRVPKKAETPAQPAKKPGVEAFVRRQQATFANYLLEDPYQVWQSKLKVDGPPVVFVFNKQGDLVQRFADEGVNYDIIGKLVARLIAE